MNFESSIKTVVFMNIDTGSIMNLVAKYSRLAKLDNKTATQAMAEMDDVFVKIETSAEFNQNLRDAILDEILKDFQETIGNYALKKLSFEAAVQSLKFSMAELDKKNQECSSFMRAFFDDYDLKKSITFWAEGLQDNPNGYTERWNVVVASEIEAASMYEQKRIGAANVVSSFSSMQKEDILQFVQENLSKASELAEAAKKVYYSGYALHASEFPHATAKETVFQHIEAYHHQKRDAKRKAKEAEFYVGLSGIWLNSDNDVFEDWKLGSPEPSIGDLDRLKQRHDRNQATLAVLAEDKFTNIDLDANLRYVEIAYEAVAKDRPIFSIPGVSSWLSKLVGKEERNKAISDVIAGCIAPARANLEHGERLLDDMILEGAKRWKTALKAPDMQTFSSGFNSHYGEQLSRFYAAMHDLLSREDTAAPKSIRDTLTRSGNFENFTNLLECILPNAELFDNKLNIFLCISARVPSLAIDGVRFVSSRSLPAPRLTPDDHAGDTFVKLGIDDLELAGQIHDLGNESTRAEIREVTTMLLEGLGNGAAWNLERRDALLRAETNAHMEVLQNIFSSEALSEPRARMSKAERQKIFHEDWAIAMTKWERENMWPRVARHILGDEGAKPFTSKRPEYHETSAAVTGVLRVLDLVDSFVDQRTPQSKAEFFKSLLKKCVNDLASAKALKDRYDPNGDPAQGSVVEPEHADRRARFELVMTKVNAEFRKCVTVSEILEGMLRVWSPENDDPDSVRIEKQIEYVRESLPSLQEKSIRRYNLNEYIKSWISSVTGAQLEPQGLPYNFVAWSSQLGPEDSVSEADDREGSFQDDEGQLPRKRS